MTLYQQTKHALGSTVILTVVTDSTTEAETLLKDLWEAVDTFESRFSRFRPDSELTGLNRRAGEPVVVSPEFRRLFLRAKELAAQTDDLYNPLILPALQSVGYISSWPAMSEPSSLDYSARQVHSAAAMQFIKTHVRIPDNSALDFGGIGKGYLLDRLAELAEPQSRGYWFSLGGDIICGGYDAQGDPWELKIAGARLSGKTIASVRNTTGERLALATSGTTKRNGSHQGSRWHHLIDPRTGKPAETDILTASVTASQGDLADVMAGCVVVLGSKQAGSFVKAHNVSALLQTDYATAHSQPAQAIGPDFTLSTKKKAETL